MVNDALLELNQLPNEYISEVPNQPKMMHDSRSITCARNYNSTPIEECDDDYDGIVSFFDLSQKTEEILNGQTGISVSYYETLEQKVH